MRSQPARSAAFKISNKLYHKMFGFLNTSRLRDDNKAGSARQGLSAK
jgi:hypothetical protein